MKKFVAALALTLALIGVSARADSGSRMINYQGRMTNLSGQPLNGAVSVVFSIYGVASNGTALWTESQTVTVNNGLYNVMLGQVTPLPENLFNGSDRWLGVMPGADPEMSPRSRITSSAYALNAQRVAGKKIESGRVTVTVTNSATGSATVVFPAAFAAPPKVITGAPDAAINGKTYSVRQVTDLTATGCTIVLGSVDGSNNTGSTALDWIAIGE